MTAWACLIGGTILCAAAHEAFQHWREKQSQRRRLERHEANNPPEES